MKKSATPQTREEKARERLRNQKIQYDKQENSRQAGQEAGCEFVLQCNDDLYRQMTTLARHTDEHRYPVDVEDLLIAMDTDPDNCELIDPIVEQMGDDIIFSFWMAGFVFGALAKFRELTA